MTVAREDRALAQLLRVAKLRAEEFGARRAHLEEARRAAENSIEWLNRAVAAEERGGGADPEALRQFQRYLAGAEMKRRTLAETRDRLSAEIAAISGALAEAALEVKKFEHLIGMRADAAARTARKQEDAAADERAVQRKSGR